MNKNKHYKVNYLSEAFYEKYNPHQYPEIERKTLRPYMVILVQFENNTFALPFRTNIRHNNCYKFKTSTRPTGSVTGIDFSKAVIINDDKYIGLPARINDKEYIELDKNYHIIILQFQKYVKDYIKFANGKLNKYESANFKYTTLRYFHNELNIS